MLPIGEIATQLGIAPEEIEPYGRYMAKVPVSLIDEKKVKKSRLILVTAISPTKAGIGKTTVSIGLTLGLNKIGKKAAVALREPSLGPCFGIKGGAAGGGYAQVLPMEKINLHFTGDFHAVTSAHNTISAEKFFDIKCRKAGLLPRLVVIVATTQGLKMHGGVDLDHIKEPNAKGLTEGLKNLNRHIRNMQGFGQPVVVTLNRHDTDLEEEIAIVRKNCEDLEVGFAVNEAFLKGGEGAIELAQTVVETIEKQQPLPIRFTYKETDRLEDKIEKVCKSIYGASAVEYGKTVTKKLESLRKSFTDDDGAIAHYPVCIAKTQFSFSADSTRYGSPEGFTIRIRDVILNCGSEMIVAIAGDMLRMPGLPKSPQAERITIENGEIEGLS